MEQSKRDWSSGVYKCIVGEMAFPASSSLGEDPDTPSRSPTLAS